MTTPISVTDWDQQLLQQTAPTDWKNPIPSGRYNLVVIGGGAAGLVSAMGAAGLGAKVALIERKQLGGDCLNYGCVPSKALLASSRAAMQIRHAEKMGIDGGESSRVNFPVVMNRLRRLRAEISRHDSAQRLKDAGVDLFFGQAHFIGEHQVQVDGQTLSFRKAILATGTTPMIPLVPGLQEIDYLTNETIFSLQELPRSLLVIGAGPVGCELAQGFARLGSHVTLLTRGQRILSHEEEEASALLLRQFQAEGIDVRFQVQLLKAEQREKQNVLFTKTPEGEQVFSAERILLAVGRSPALDGLGLEQAGIRSDQQGVWVNDRLQTTNRAVFAAGDICASLPRYTHAADAMARLCVQNALFLGRKKYSSLVIPHCTYTDPEVGRVGICPQEIMGQSYALETLRLDMNENDRAVLEGGNQGFVSLHFRRGGSQVLGATVVGTHAGDLINEISLLITARVSLRQLAETIRCYPTRSEVLKRLGDAYNRRRLTPKLAEWLQRWFAWRR